MKIKSKILYLIFALPILIIGCEKEYVEPNSFSDLKVFTTEFTKTIWSVNIDDYISFSALGNGAQSHTWTIEEGSHFLSGGITVNDTNHFDQFIIPGAGLESNDKTIHVLFTRPGAATVRLYDTYTEPVWLCLHDTLEATQVGDLWVIDTTFIVQVFESIQPAFTIATEDNPDVILTADTIVVEAFNTLLFTDMTTAGAPNARTWSFDDEGISTDSIAEVDWEIIGDKQVTLVSIREPGDFELPNASTGILLPHIIRVIPSSEPFTIKASGALELLSDSIIEVSCIKKLAPGILGQESFFEVEVDNIPVGISDVSNSEDGNKNFNITLSNTVPSPSTITVTYSGGGIESIDTRLLEDFTSDLAN